MTQTTPPATRFSEQEKADLCRMISLGCDRETACKYWGWTAADLNRQLQQDAGFAEQLLHAEAQVEFTHVKNLYLAAKEGKYWRASVWWLERHAPQRFARRGPDTLTARQIAQVIDRLAAAIAEEVSHETDRRRLLSRIAEIARQAEIDSYAAQTPTELDPDDDPPGLFNP